jgi:hypothetical protein
MHCDKCGIDYSENARFCPNCGSALTDTKNEAVDNASAPYDVPGQPAQPVVSEPVGNASAQPSAPEPPAQTSAPVPPVQPTAPVPPVPVPPVPPTQPGAPEPPVQASAPVAPTQSSAPEPPASANQVPVQIPQQSPQQANQQQLYQQDLANQQQAYQQQVNQQQVYQQQVPVPPVAPVPYPMSQKDSTLRLINFIFCVITTVCSFWLILPLAWMIPMTVHSWGIYKGTKPNTVAFGVCTLIFVSRVGGILLLVSDKDK